MLIDAGPSNAKAVAGVSASSDFFDRHIDAVIATHADADHIGGLPKILHSYSTSLYLEPGVPASTSLYKNLMAQIREMSEFSTKRKNTFSEMKHLVARRGMKIVLDADAGISFEVLFPDDEYILEKYTTCISKLKGKKPRKNAKPCESSLEMETNEGSIVGRLAYGNISFLFTGDSPISVERFLISEFLNKLASTVLKVGHHGSKTSTSPDFVSAVSSSYAVISAGKDNQYGHPHKNVLQNLTGTEILRTDASGAIRFESDGIRVWQR